MAQAAGREQRAGLVAGGENPADDTASLPYLPSTQILLWHTAMRLAAREGELGIGELGLTAQADTVRAAIRDRFACVAAPDVLLPETSGRMERHRVRTGFRPMLTARTGMLAGEELSPCARVSLPASRTTPDSAGSPDDCNACSAGRPGVNLALGGERVGQRVDGEAEWSCRGSCGALPTRQ